MHQQIKTHSKCHDASCLWCALVEVLGHLVEKSEPNETPMQRTVTGDFPVVNGPPPKRRATVGRKTAVKQAHKCTTSIMFQSPTMVHDAQENGSSQAQTAPTLQTLWECSVRVDPTAAISAWNPDKKPKPLRSSTPKRVHPISKKCAPCIQLLNPKQKKTSMMH